MFKVGQTYEVTMIEFGPEGPEESTYYNCIVREVAMPVVKFNQFDKEWIINVTAPTFSAAKPQKA